MLPIMPPLMIATVSGCGPPPARDHAKRNGSVRQAENVKVDISLNRKAFWLWIGGAVRDVCAAIGQRPVDTGNHLSSPVRPSSVRMSAI